MADTMTESSAFAEDDQASSEMLDLIKARTMYQMVEEIDGGARKLYTRTPVSLTSTEANYTLHPPGTC